LKVRKGWPDSWLSQKGVRSTDVNAVSRECE
jgi:hypothetical protein